MDRDRIEAFLDQFIRHASGATTIALLTVAEQAGLIEHLAKSGGGTAPDIAANALLEERYVLEILSGLTAAAVLDYTPDDERFTLPPEHALFLADETSPYFMGGWLDMIPALMAQIRGVATATVHGGGVGFEEFGPDMIRGIDRGNSPSQTVFLTSRWLPAVPGLEARLNEGIRVADVGCGAGTSAILMADAYPKCHVAGFDISEESIAIARSRGEGRGNLEFQVYAAHEIPIEPPFDLITTFDVIHDLDNPLLGMRRIREALAPDGQYLMMEPNASSLLEENINPRGALLYGVSALHCMTQSLAMGGEGLGAVWGRQRAREFATEAGFSEMSTLEDITNRFSAFYLLTP